MTGIFSVCGGIVQTIMSGIWGMATASITVPQEIVDVESVDFLASIPLWLVFLFGNLFIKVMFFILILTVYGRFSGYTSIIAPALLPLAFFAGEGTSFFETALLKNYAGVCLEEAIIVLACLIFSAFMSSGAPVVDTSLSAVTMSWQCIGQYDGADRTNEGQGTGREGIVWTVGTKNKSLPLNDRDLLVNINFYP